MIQISAYRDESGRRNGFYCIGHAGFAKKGQDIICAAVSALVMNTVNSIDAFTSDTFSYDEDQERGMMDFRLTSEVSDASGLLLDSLFLGLSGIEGAYGRKYIRINETKL